MKNIFLKKDKKEKGFAVLLSILVLVSITGLVIAVSNVSFRVTKSNQSIINSEEAFFAAESAAEITIYDIAKNKRGLDLPDLADQQQTGVEGATWDRQVRLADQSPGICSAPKPKVVCSDAAGLIDGSNVLNVTLQDGESFQYDLVIVGLDEYPNHLRVKGAGSGSSVTILSIESGVASQETDTGNNIRIPASGQITTDYSQLSFLIDNESGAEQTFTVEPQGSTDPMPLGLNILTTGRFLNTERRLEVFRPSWLIY